jgi:hypothetical protein
MRITLRKANKLRNKLQAKNQELRTELSETQTGNTVTIFDPDVVAQVQARENEFKSIIARFSSTSILLAYLKSVIAEKNVASGVSEKLSILDGLTNRLVIWRQLSDVEARPTDEQIVSRLEGLKAAAMVNANRYGDNNTFNVSFLSKETVTACQNEVTRVEREIAALNDTIEELNASTLIDLDDASVA